jgi:CheY-like chemotaxis protein
VYAILTNLIKNAVKYSDAGSINFGYDKKDNFLEFYVKDTGIGIPVHRQVAIFDRFVQADIADTQARQGAGLGLSISKAYVEMLGGKIWVQSEEGKGSTFYFTLPFEVEHAENKKSDEDLSGEVKPSAVNSGMKHLKILIAEDDDVSQQLLSAMMSRYSREIFEVRSGLEAVEYCHQYPDLDLILMDIQLPDMNGYEATREIRKFNTTVIILAQTAYGLSSDRDKAIEAGCNDYIAKPIHKKELAVLVNKYFNVT